MRTPHVVTSRPTTMVTMATWNGIRLPVGPWLTAPAAAPLSRLGRLPGGEVGVPVAARDRADAPPDVVVDVVGKIGEGHAQRPVRGLEAAAVQQHDAVVLGQAEGQVEGVDVALQVLHRVLP